MQIKKTRCAFEEYEIRHESIPISWAKYYPEEGNSGKDFTRMFLRFSDGVEYCLPIHDSASTTGREIKERLTQISKDSLDWLLNELSSGAGELIRDVIGTCDPIKRLG